MAKPKVFSIIGFLDKYSVIIKIDKDEAASLEVEVGSKARVIAKIIDVKDQDERDLGKYMIYKEELTVSEISDHFLIAKKIVSTGSNIFENSVLFSGQKKHVEELEINDEDSILYDVDDSALNVGDQVTFE